MELQKGYRTSVQKVKADGRTRVIGEEENGIKMEEIGERNVDGGDRNNY